VLWQLTLAQNQQVRKMPRQNTAGLFYFRILKGNISMKNIARNTKIENKKHKKQAKQMRYLACCLRS
jgi:hypothetical protein